jgi:hypothetical protein
MQALRAPETTKKPRLPNQIKRGQWLPCMDVLTGRSGFAGWWPAAFLSIGFLLAEKAFGADAGLALKLFRPVADREGGLGFPRVVSKPI